MDEEATAERQFLWGQRYLDDLVLRDRDVDHDGSMDERLYVLSDGGFTDTSDVWLFHAQGFCGYEYFLVANSLGVTPQSGYCVDGAVAPPASLPGCPPLETVVAFWTADGTEHRFKLFKRVEDVARDEFAHRLVRVARRRSRAEPAGIGSLRRPHGTPFSHPGRRLRTG